MPKSKNPAKSTSSSAPSPLQRLPVNPRRKKVAPDERKRVATACNSCNVRRIKCSGERPCWQCSSSSRECLYPEPVEKVTIPKSELDDLRRRLADYESRMAGSSATRSPESRHTSALSPLNSGSVIAASPSSSSRAETSTIDGNLDGEAQRNEGKLLHDTDGTSRYHGVTSGATFLDNVKEFMRTIVPLVSNFNPTDVPGAGPGFGQVAHAPSGVVTAFLDSVGQYQTYDSRPLHLPSDVDPRWLPPRSDMADMLTQLRFFIQDGENGEFGSGGIFFWDVLGNAPPDPSSLSLSPNYVYDRNLAFYHTAFAFATLLSRTEPNSKQDGQLGEHFLARARILLGNPLDITMYTTNDVSVLALMALYLIENNRRDAAYIAVSNAIHVSIMHGVHRGCSVDEKGRRTFWTVIILDRWLSCLMGRPPTILDDAITLPLPQECPGLPCPAGLRAHIELSRISNYIVYHSYRVSVPQWHDGPEKVALHVETALQMLTEWLSNLPDGLKLRTEIFSMDRALCSLHMAHNQLVILTVRPVFLTAVKKAVADRWLTRQWNIEDHPQITHIRDCSDAARCNLRLGRWIRGISPVRTGKKLLLSDLHHIFNAAIVLMMHQIVFVNLRTNDVSDIEFAIEVFEGEASTGSIYGKDCARVLKELLALVQTLRALIFDHPEEQGPLPGEQILASLMHATSPGLDAPAFAGHSRPASGPAQPIPAGGEAILQQLITWRNNDDMQLYNSYLV
ncbi:fungal-specific transcription factor domain-containing protein [Diplogelasinospora grovesii]|uniref:Fungal-specific transcription factor domain-containing protein n=1 Tax=Diplogelasinospora grovesii TaxID=303347 RepID=A0AAN6S306_9PEZI|nr:fungal-specific transcription factor domain-containing protein [Diplogelasinospora grovesii]